MSVPMSNMKRRGTTAEDDSSFEYDGDAGSAKSIVRASFKPVDEMHGGSIGMGIMKTTDVEIRTDIGEWNSKDRSWDAV